MTIPKKYFHDKIVLLLLSINAFLLLVTTLLIVFRFDFDRDASYIVQYRANLGLTGYKPGSIIDIISFIVFALMVGGLHFLLSIRAYHVRREYSVAILAFGSLLLLLALIVSNALLVLR